MLKKVLLISILVFSYAHFALADDIEVMINPAASITTSNVYLQEGDEIKFVLAKDVYVNSNLYLKKGIPVTGVITSIEDNDFFYKEASLYAENFKTKDVNGKTVKLKGIVYKKGNTHWKLTQFLPRIVWVLRGGEVQMKPEKDSFILFLEDKNAK